MIKLRPARERGKTKTSWLDSNHSFSFNRYYDPAWSGFRDLLVINEDFVAPAHGFGTHSHPEVERRGKLRLVASRNGSDGSVTIHQDVKVYDALLAAGEEVSYQLDGDRHAWIQVVKGAVTVNRTPLGTSDGAAISEEPKLTIMASKEAEILIFDLV